MATSTIRQLIIDGFRESGLVETGGVPDADEFEEGLRKLQSMYSSLFGNELGEQLTSVNFGTSGMVNPYGIAEDLSSDITNMFVPSNTRLVLNVGATATVYLNPNPKDGARVAVVDNGGNIATYPLTLDGNGRKIETGGSVTLNTNALTREWFYRADLGEWTRVTDLVAGDASPLPGEFDDMISTMLAVRLNPRYGASMAQETMDVLERGRRIFRARYRQEAEQSCEDGITRLPSNPYTRRY